MSVVTDKEIREFMIHVPNSKIPQLDIVLCDKNYNDKGDNPTEFKGIRCKNYRGIDVCGTIYYLKVGSIDLDSPESYSYDVPQFDEYYFPITDTNGNDVIKKENIYIDFINKKCDQKSPVLLDFKSRGLLDKDSIVYFKGAYTSFPPEWKDASEKLEKERKTNPHAKLPDNIIQDIKKKKDIYVKGTRSILIHILPYLKKIGIKTLIVDPEPGFHPNTIYKNSNERLEGLFGLYESMGLKRIKCYYRTSGMELIRNNYLTQDNDIREASGMKNTTPEFDTDVMIGSIDEMLDKFKWVNIPFISKILGFFNTEIQETQNFMGVPFKFSTDVHKDYLTKEEVDKIKATSITLVGGSDYKQKYLKYKSKYLNLKYN